MLFHHLQVVNGFLYRWLPKSAQAKLDSAMAGAFGSIKSAVPFSGSFSPKK
jgi:hypothetical protein